MQGEGGGLVEGVGMTVVEEGVEVVEGVTWGPAESD